MLERILVPETERDETKLSATLAKLVETDRGLKVMQEEGTGAQLVCAQGPVHLRDLRSELLLKLVVADLCGIEVGAMLEEQHDHIERLAEAYDRTTRSAVAS